MASPHDDRRAREASWVGENLRRLLGAFLVRQDDLATALGISRQAVQNIVRETSPSVPSMGNAQRIARAFGIRVDDLFADPQTCLRAAVENLDTAPASQLRRIGGEPPSIDPAAFQLLVNPFLAGRKAGT